MAGSARLRHFREFMDRMYPAFSRRARQVCILSSALEKIALGQATQPHVTALVALNEADAFGWRERSAARNAGVRANSETSSTTSQQGNGGER